jgi:hypothetical protein
MSLEKHTFGIIEASLYSAGLCDTCKVPEMINTGGNNSHNPAYEELYCKKKKIFIDPQLPEFQIKECDGFEIIENH